MRPWAWPLKAEALPGPCCLCRLGYQEEFIEDSPEYIPLDGVPLAINRYHSCDRGDLCRDSVSPITGGLQLNASFLFNFNRLLPDGETQSQALILSSFADHGEAQE